MQSQTFTLVPTHTTRPALQASKAALGTLHDIAWSLAIVKIWGESELKKAECATDRALGFFIATPNII
jgi:hypothetical protein